MRASTRFLSILLCLSFAACGDSVAPQEGPIEVAEAELAFVSGHIGRDCAAEATGSLIAGDCAEGTECPSYDQCGPGRLILAVENLGNVVAQAEVLGVEIQVGGESIPASEPRLLGVSLADDAAFDGAIPVDAEVQLHVSFTGPSEESVSPGTLTTVVVRVELNGEIVELLVPDLIFVPNVAT